MSNTVLQEVCVEFTLKYRGELPAARGRCNMTQEKHDMRLEFHRQIRRIWEKDNRFVGIDRAALPLPTGNFDVERPIKLHKQPLRGFMFRVPLRDISFIPLVTAPMEASCHLSVRLGRPLKPGSIIFAGGDLDRRLVILFDALRIPREDQELPDSVGEDKEVLCLLADDSLITKLTIEPHEILGDYSNDRFRFPLPCL